MTNNDNLKFTVQLKLDNEAMRDSAEVARILRLIAQQVSDYAGDTPLDVIPSIHKNLMDINGNTIGSWDIGF